MLDDPDAAPAGRSRPEAPAEGEWDPGAWLVEHRFEMDRGESAWLERLGRFDLEEAWRDDGQLSCAEWLMWRTQMARSTAYEKLRIAHQLIARPAVAAAFADGRLSYSAVRAITRIDGPDPEVDDALINLAQAGCVNDIEHAVRAYQLHADQHRPPPNPRHRRALYIRPGLDGTTSIEITLEATEAEELAAVIQAFLENPTPAQSAAEDNIAQSSAEDNPGQSSAEDNSGDQHGEEGEEAPMEQSAWPQRRADALLDMVRVAMAHVADSHAMGADRYLVHLVARDANTTLIDGTPLHPAVAQRIACDQSSVTHIVDGAGEPLHLGRKTRDWNTAQRRAIAVRDRGRCRFPGCQRHHADIHHLQHWEHGGPTDITNGLLICAHHHTLLHNGYHATGDANHTVTFHRPNHTPLGTTQPQRR